MRGLPRNAHEACHLCRAHQECPSRRGSSRLPLSGQSLAFVPDSFAHVALATHSYRQLYFIFFVFCKALFSLPCLCIFLSSWPALSLYKNSSKLVSLHFCDVFFPSSFSSLLAAAIHALFLSPAEENAHTLLSVSFFYEAFKES